MSDRVQAIASAVVLVATLYLIGTAGGAPITGEELRSVPRCEEDATLVGVGSFEAGRWSAYECGPALDDFAP